MTTPTTTTIGRNAPRRQWLTAILIALAAALATVLPAPPAEAQTDPVTPVTAMAASVTLDPGFAAAVPAVGTGTVNAVAVQPDGKVLIGGTFSYQANGTTTTGIARLNRDGTLDSSFQPTTAAGGAQGGAVLALGLQSDGRIIVGGLFTTWNGQTRGRMVRLLANGALDESFNATPAGPGFPGSGFNRPVRALVVQSDNKIVVGGQFTSANGSPRAGIARLNADGTVDAAFDADGGVSGANASVAAVALDKNGRILLGGDFTTVGGEPRGGLARLRTDGALDPAFTVGSGFGPGYPATISVQQDQRIVVGGGFSRFNGQTRNDLVRLDTTGALDPSFDTGAGFTDDAGNDAGAASVLAQPDGGLVVGGAFAAYQGTSRPGIVRLRGNGAVDPLFDPGAGLRTQVPNGLARSGTVLALASHGGRLTVAGTFTSYNGATVPSVIALTHTPTAGARFVPLSTPVRVYDSRELGQGPVSKASPRIVDLTGGGKAALPSGTTAVAYNLTVTGQTSSGYATVTSAELVTEPLSSSINWQRGKQTVANGHITAVDDSNRAKVFVGGTGTAEIIIDVVGFFQPGAPSGAIFVPVMPTRVLNTLAGGTPLQPGVPVSVNLPAASNGVVPANAVAVSFNLTITGTRRTGFVTAAPGGAPVPTNVSTVNWSDSPTTTSNASIVRVNGGSMQVQSDPSGGTTAAIVDVTGYFLPHAAGGGQLFYPVTPTRAYDSRLPGAGGELAGSAATGLTGQPRTTAVNLGGAIPANATAIAYNLTVTGTTASGFAANAPSPPTPTTSSLNWPGERSLASNASIVGVDAAGRVTTWVGGRGRTHYLIDVVGYFAP